MELEVPRLVLERPSNESIVVESKLQFEIKNFKAYEKNEKLLVEMKMSEVGAVW
jgi:hypothetical protein